MDGRIPAQERLHTHRAADGPVLAPKHTPGPWLVRQPGGTVVITPSGDGRTFSEVARTVSGSLNSERHANARLIAAAPDLLEALTEALDSERRRRDAGETYVVSVITQMEAAIAKATTAAEADSVGTEPQSGGVRP